MNCKYIYYDKNVLKYIKICFIKNVLIINVVFGDKFCINNFKRIVIRIKI